MTETHTLDAPAPRLTPTDVMHRMAFPVLLFSSIFAAALGVSRVAILPMLTAVEVDGVVRDAMGLREHAEELREEIATFERERDTELFPLDDTPYRTLVDAKISISPMTDLLDTFRALSLSVIPEEDGTILITSMEYASTDSSVTLIGDVRGVGPGSMTVLAQFTEVLRDDPRVLSLIAPKFTRLQDKDIGPHSPFVITVILR